MNVLGLQIFPHLGLVTDELVLAVPDEWDRDDVVELVASSGGELVAVDRCSERSLNDVVTTYLRVAAHLLAEPSALSDALVELLDTESSTSSGGGQDVLRVDVCGKVTEVRRAIPFTEVERARAVALAQFAQWDGARRGAGGDVGARTGPPTRDDAGWTVRPGAVSDVAAARRMHDRCSTETLFRRYHSPAPGLSSAFATRLLEPEGGTSFVAAVGDEVVGMVVLAPHRPGVMEVGVLVEDGWRRQGIGSALLRAAAIRASRQGVESMLAIMQPDNRTLLPVLRHCGMTCLVRTVDGVAHVTVPLARFAPDLSAAPSTPRSLRESGASSSTSASASC